MVIINSTILSGAGAIPSLTSLLPDIRKMLLVTDRNIAQLDGVQQIRALLEKHCPQVNVIDNVPAEPTHHDVRQLMDALGDASLMWWSGSAVAACWMWRSCYRCFAIHNHRGWMRCLRVKTDSAGAIMVDSYNRRNRLRSHAECDSGNPEQSTKVGIISRCCYQTMWRFSRN